MSYFEIIDQKGVVESPFQSFDEAMEKLNLLLEDNFIFEGDIKIVEVHYITR